MMRLLLLLLPVPAFAETAASANVPSLSSWLLSSLMVIGLILVLGFLLKKSKLATAMGGGQMRVIASLPVGYKEKLLVVKVGEQQPAGRRNTAAGQLSLPAGGAAGRKPAAGVFPAAWQIDGQA